MNSKYLQIEQERVGATVKFVREARGLTQKELAEISGISRSTIAKIERGLVPIPNIRLTQLSSALLVQPIVLANPMLINKIA